MKAIDFEPVELQEIEARIVAHNSGLPSPIDSFAEDHILASNHYRIHVSPPPGNGPPANGPQPNGAQPNAPPGNDPPANDTGEIGYCCVHDGGTLTQFVVENRFGAFAQEAFFAARRLEFVREALVATCDESFLSLCLDDHKEVVKQAYFFQSVGGSGSRPPIQSRGDRPDREGAASAEVGGVPFETHGKQTAADAVSYRLMNASEFQLVRDHSDDFFEESLSRQLDAGRIHGGFLGDEPVAFGIIEPGGIRKDVASIGMFTKPTHRRRGFGRATLLYLSRRCRERDLEPVAGCWYYNHLSKKTLESAGFITKTRYLRIRF